MIDAEDTDATDGDPVVDVAAMEEIRPGAWMAPSQQIVVDELLIAGRCFSHRITEHELVAGWLEMAPDFAALGAFSPRYLTMGDEPVEIVEPGGHERVPSSAPGMVLLGPDGWLDQGFADAYAVISAEGETLDLRWERRDLAPPADAAPVVELFESLDAGAGVVLLDLLLHLLVRHPELFDAGSAPVTDLLDTAGLAVTGELVARAGDPVPAQPSGPARLPGLRLDSSLAARRLLEAVLEARAGRSAADGIVLAALADGDAVGAVAEQIVGAELVPPADLERWLDTLTVPPSGPARAGAGFLRSRLAEWLGDAAAEEEALRTSILTSELSAAQVDAAWFASDRGDARAALALMRAAGVPADDPEVELMRAFTVTGPNDVGRNKSCWCGSGRKHKHCCLRLNGHGLQTRARWLHAKAITFLQRPPQRQAMMTIAAAYAGVGSADEAPDQVIAAACDTTVAELCLFEGGVFALYLERRGFLLPDDELELADTWTSARHSLWHVLDGGSSLREHGSDVERELDGPSGAKLPSEGAVLAVVTPGPLALPGPVLPIPASAVEEMAALVQTGSATALAARIGQEFGWTASPDLSFARSRGAGAVAAVR